MALSTRLVGLFAFHRSIQKAHDLHIDTQNDMTLLVATQKPNAVCVCVTYVLVQFALHASIHIVRRVE